MKKSIRPSMLLAIFVLLCISSCTKNHTYKYFEYCDAEIKNDLGEIHIGLRGNFTKVKHGILKETHKGNPYELWVWFETQNQSIESISVNKVEARYKKNGKLIISNYGGSFTTKWSDYSKTYHGGWHIKGVNLDYEKISIKMKISINHSGQKTEQNIEIDLLPEKYKEELRNDFWDALMSV